MYAYCGNNPVNCVDPSGRLADWILRWLLKQSIKAFQKEFGNAGYMLMHWVAGSGKDISYNNDSDLVKKIKKSDIMNAKLDESLKKYYNEGDANPGDDVIFDSSGDWDLWLSLRSASYETSIRTVQLNCGFFKICYEEITVKITDTYNFNKFENDDGIGSLFTNIGYFVQELGVGKEYRIEVNYTCTRNWRIIW